MKTYKLLILFLLLSTTQSLLAQVQPDELKVFAETNCKLRYYYYPNLEAYYDAEKQIYLFKQDGKWITADAIPTGYRGYSLFNKSNVPIKDYDDDNPVQFLEQHRKLHPYNTLKRVRMIASRH